MKLCELAEQLDVSTSMISRLRRRGMPTNSVAAARAWRTANLDPALVKGARATLKDDRVAAVYRLGLAVLNDPSRLEELRNAFPTLTAAEERRVKLHVRVWDMLVAPTLPPLEPHL